MFIERRQQLKRKEIKERRLPIIDFNQQCQRNAFILFLRVLIIFMIFSAVGSYRAYVFTDSVFFVGKSAIL